MTKMPNKQSGEKRNIKAIVLAGGLDFGCCSLESRLPVALWPIASESVLRRLLQSLAQQGITEAVVCSYEDTEQLAKSIGSMNGMKLTFLDEPMPLGPAGSIRQAVNADDISSLLVIHAGIIGSLDTDELLAEHKKSKSDLTIVLCSENDRNQLEAGSAGIYLCEPAILEYIPAEGYCDIKETLVPALLKAGRKVSVKRLARSVESFRDWQGYIHAVAVYLDNADKTDIDLPVTKSTDGKNIWISSDAKVDETVRIFGPVVIMDGAVLARNAVILGPAIIGANVSIGHGAMVSESVLWDNARIGANCEIRKCLLDYKTIIPDAAVLENKLVSAKENAMLQKASGKIKEFSSKKTQQLQSFIQPRVNNLDMRLPGGIKSGERHKSNFTWLAACALIAAFTWSYWSTITDLWKIWMQSDEYSSGLLVPLLAVYIAWSRRDQFAQCQIQPSMWGLFAFIAAQGFRHSGLFFMYNSVERFSLVASIAALVLLLYGRTVFRKSLTILLFLGLMLPLPRSFEAKITLPLQHLATSSAVFSLEMLGYEVAAEGNIIHLGQTTVAVAEACNGLRMVTSFFVISGLVLLLVRRAWWEKLILLLSTLPVALFCNTVRLTITSIAFTILKGEYWEKVFHNYGGYAMMPLALAIVVCELWILTKIITVPVDHKQEEILVTRSKQ
jgi:exosortase